MSLPFDRNEAVNGTLLSIPGGLFEVAFGIRLIAKGFDSPAANAYAATPA